MDSAIGALLCERIARGPGVFKRGASGVLALALAPALAGGRGAPRVEIRSERTRRRRVRSGWMQECEAAVAQRHG